MRKLLPILLVSAALIPLGVVSASAAHGLRPRAKTVRVPEEDRFLPFAITIRAGGSVRWVNGDEDDHAVVSDDVFNTAGHKGTDEVIEPGASFLLRFDHPGTFVYYCRFHAQLDEFGQPVAPGPDGGIQDQNGNFGTPMSGVVTVLPED